jgi:hypothetical protein
MPKQYDSDNVDDKKPPVKTKVVNGFRESYRAGAGWSKKGVFTDKMTGEKYTRSYPAMDVMQMDKSGNFSLNPNAYTTLNRGDKSNKAVDPFYKGNVKGDRMLAKLAALDSARKMKGK